MSAQLRSAFKDVGVTLELQALASPVYTDALFTVKRLMSFYEGGADSPDPAYAGRLLRVQELQQLVGYKSAAADACLADAGAPQLAWDQRVQAHKRCVKIIEHDALALDRTARLPGEHA